MVVCQPLEGSPFSLAVLFLGRVFMKKLFFSLLSATAIALSPVAVRAQSFDVFPTDAGCPVVVAFICRDFLPNGSPILYSIPSGYSGRYILTVNRVEQNNLVFMFDTQNQHISGYMVLDPNMEIVDRFNGRPGVGGNLELLQEVIDEMVVMLGEIRLY
jgi:hypothetical protein